MSVLGNAILLKIITRIKLLFLNYLGRYSYSFRVRWEFISITVTVLAGLTGIFSLQLQFVYSGHWAIHTCLSGPARVFFFL